MLPGAKKGFREIKIDLALIAWFVDQLDSELAPEGPLQHSRQERVQLGDGIAADIRRASISHCC